MHKDDQKLSIWMIVAAIACCGLPLLLLAGGGSVLVLGTSFLTNNALLLALGLILVLIFAWLLLKRGNSE